MVAHGRLEVKWAVACHGGGIRVLSVVPRLSTEQLPMDETAIYIELRWELMHVREQSTVMYVWNGINLLIKSSQSIS